MNTVKRLVINHLKRGRVNQLKESYGILGERGEIMRKKDYIEKLTPILLNMIYDRRHQLIVSCFLANPENRRDLKRMMPRICHEETIIPEENLRELKGKLLKLKNCIKFFFKK